MPIKSKLDCSIPFRFDLVWNDTNCDKKIDQLFYDLELNSGYKQELKKKLLKLVIVNLINAYHPNNNSYLAYSRNSGNYADLAKKHGEHIAYKSMKAIADSLKTGDFIEDHLGVNFRYFKRDSRMRMTKKLRDLLNRKIILNNQIEIDPYANCIVQRQQVITTKPTLDQNGKPAIYKIGPNKGNPRTEEIKTQIDVDYEETTETKRMRSTLTAYNNLLRRTFIDIPDFPDNGLEYEGTDSNGKATKNTIWIDDSNKFVRRIFNNNSWEDGGRFYGGWWTNLPKEWRDKIKLNDEWTVEVDYSGLHIKLLYNLKGIEYVDDPYEIQIPYFKIADKTQFRELIKTVFLILINAKDEISGIRGIRKSFHDNKELHWFKKQFGETNKKTLTNSLIKKLIDPIKIKHKRINKYFMSGEGIRLMNLDSRIAEEVINFYTMEQTPILCVHDSFIVPISHSNDLNGVMAEATRKIVNQEIKTRQDTTKSYEYLFKTLGNKRKRDWQVKPTKRFLTRLSRWKTSDNKEEDYYKIKENLK